RQGFRRRRARSRAGTSFSRQMSLGQIRGRATQHLDLLLEEAIALTELAQLGGILLRLTRLFAGFDAGLTHPLVESSDMDAEVFRDLREGDVWVAVLRDPDDVVAELLGERLGHDDILPGQPSRLAMFDVTSSYIRPGLLREPPAGLPPRTPSLQFASRLSLTC